MSLISVSTKPPEVPVDDAELDLESSDDPAAEADAEADDELSDELFDELSDELFDELFDESSCCVFEVWSPLRSVSSEESFCFVSGWAMTVANTCGLLLTNERNSLSEALD
jgi:hypothetical protein